jgi:hypothetical protein
MTLFHYKAIGADGKQVDGEMEAADSQSVIAQLRSAGHLPISAVPKTERHDLGKLLARFTRRSDRVRPADITALTRELATLLHAGMPLDAALKILERHSPAGTRLKATLKRIHTDVQGGLVLYEPRSCGRSQWLAWRRHGAPRDTSRANRGIPGERRFVSHLPRHPRLRRSVVAVRAADLRDSSLHPAVRGRRRDAAAAN